MTCVAFAGVSPIREAIVRAALDRVGNFRVVEPWTSLDALSASGAESGETDILFIELADARLPCAVRAMQAASSRLHIIALAVDASWARVYELREEQTVLRHFVADDLCAAICAATWPASTQAS